MVDETFSGQSSGRGQPAMHASFVGLALSLERRRQVDGPGLRSAASRLRPCVSLPDAMVARRGESLKPTRSSSISSR